MMTAELWEGISQSEYHADRSADSHSSLEQFRDSPARYHAIRTGKIPQPEPSLDMRIGSTVHCLLLTPHQLSELVAVGPDAAPHSKQYREWKALNQGKTLLSIDQMARAQAIAEAVREHGLAFDLLFGGDGPTEQAVRWQDDASGLLLKCRFDRVLPKPRYAVDVKVTGNPFPDVWARTAHNLHYHNQAAHYLEGFEAVYGEPGEFLFICVHSEAPYEVCVNELDAAALDLGRQQNAETREKLAWHKQTDIWQSPFSDGINSVALPRYAFFQQ